MLRFFRQIRQRLLPIAIGTDNKFSKYLLYAVGEILLVVIGILIALQINNWNEDRQIRQKEEVILNSLKAELIVNLAELKSDYKGNESFLQSTLRIYDIIKNKPPETDSMYYHFYNSVQFNYFFPKTSVYQTLRSGDLNILRSDSLKNIITDIYESGFSRLLKKVDTRRNAPRILFPYYQEHFRTQVLPGKDSLDFFVKIGVPINYPALINDPKYETLIIEAISGRANFSHGYEQTIAYVENCLRLIEEYIQE